MARPDSCAASRCERRRRGPSSALAGLRSASRHDSLPGEFSAVPPAKWIPISALNLQAFLPRETRWRRPVCKFRCFCRCYQQIRPAVRANRLKVNAAPDDALGGNGRGSPGPRSAGKSYYGRKQRPTPIQAAFSRGVILSRPRTSMKAFGDRRQRAGWRGVERNRRQRKRSPSCGGSRAFVRRKSERIFHAFPVAHGRRASADRRLGPRRIRRAGLRPDLRLPACRRAPFRGRSSRPKKPPPPLPVYEQPPMPAPGYHWTPGYWAWNNSDYYWVPGVWVEPPRVGCPVDAALLGLRRRRLSCSTPAIGRRMSASTAGSITASATPAPATRAADGRTASSSITARSTISAPLHVDNGLRRSR